MSQKNFLFFFVPGHSKGDPANVLVIPKREVKRMTVSLAKP